MLEELDLLAERVSQLAALAAQLRSENQQLRIQLAASEAEIKRLTGTLNEARNRVEMVISRLPSEAGSPPTHQ